MWSSGRTDFVLPSEVFNVGELEREVDIVGIIDGKAVFLRKFSFRFGLSSCSSHGD